MALSVWPNYTYLVCDACVRFCVHLWVDSCMGICGPLETESNMFKISIKLILVVAHLQPKGLLHVLSANHCVCVCVCVGISACLWSDLCLCVCCLGCVLLCVWDRRQREMNAASWSYRGYRAYLFLVFPSHRLVSCHWSQQPHLLFPLSPDRQRETRASRMGWRRRRREGGWEEGEEKGKGISLQPPLAAAAQSSCKEPHRKWRIWFCPNVISLFLSASLWNEKIIWLSSTGGQKGREQSGRSLARTRENFPQNRCWRSVSHSYQGDPQSHNIAPPAPPSSPDTQIYTHAQTHMLGFWVTVAPLLQGGRGSSPHPSVPDWSLTWSAVTAQPRPHRDAARRKGTNKVQIRVLGFWFFFFYFWGTLKSPNNE